MFAKTIGGTLMRQTTDICIDNKTGNNHIPIIDLGLLNTNTSLSSRSTVIEDIGRACRKFGCFQVVNHGISSSVMNGALEAAREFFEVPSDQKSKFASTDLKKPVRYEAALKGDKNKSRFLLKHYANPLPDWLPLWPQNPPYYRERMGVYANEVQRISIQLINAIIESLGLARNYLTEKLQQGMQLMAVNYYPKISSFSDNFKIGLSPHSDYGFITILLQTCDGLQITQSNGATWEPVHVQPDTLHIHLGDYLEVLSNGRYKSLVHQAVHGEENRISIASIHGFSMDEMVRPLQQLVDNQQGEKYRESNFRDFLEYISNGSTMGGKRFIESLWID